MSCRVTLSFKPVAGVFFLLHYQKGICLTHNCLLIESTHSQTQHRGTSVSIAFCFTSAIYSDRSLCKYIKLIILIVAFKQLHILHNSLTENLQDTVSVLTFSMHGPSGVFCFTLFMLSVMAIPMAVLHALCSALLFLFCNKGT